MLCIIYSFDRPTCPNDNCMYPLNRPIDTRNNLIQPLNMLFDSIHSIFMLLINLLLIAAG